MKKNSNKDYYQFKKIANKISVLIKNGQWNSLKEADKKSLYSTLLFYFEKVKQFFSRRKLSRALGAAYVLLAGTSLSAQTFALPDTNAFNMQGAGSYFSKTDFVDIDNDGDLDLFTNDYNGSILFQENIGNVNAPNFAAQSTNPFGISGVTLGYAYTTHLADIDGDGDYDLFITGYYGNVTFFENIGTSLSPSFGPEQVGPFGLSDTYNIMSDVVDIDGDGDLDIIAFKVGYGTTGFIFVENVGTATAPLFTAPVNNPFGISGMSSYVSIVDFVDLDFDGDLDMMRADFYGTEIFYHENIGTATAPSFANGTGVASPFNISSLVYSYTISPTMADIDGDGDQDLFVSEYYGTIFYYENLQYNLGLLAGNDVVELEVFPNPTSDRIKINMLNEQGLDFDVKIINLNGKLVYQELNSLQSPIDVSNLSNGSFYVLIQDNKGQVYKSQFVKQ